MPSGRDRPLYNTDPPSCNSSALTSRRAFALLVPEPTFSERSLQWLLFATRHFCRFGPFLTSTAPSAGGITPFLQNCRLTVMIYRLYSDSHTTSQDLLFSFWPRFFRKVTYFAKTFQFQPNNSIYQPFFRVNNEFKFSTFSSVNLKCLAAQGVPRFFAKYVTLRKFLCHFWIGKRTPNGVLFYVIPLRKPIPSTALRL